MGFLNVLAKVADTILDVAQGVEEAFEAIQQTGDVTIQINTARDSKVCPRCAEKEGKRIVVEARRAKPRGKDFGNWMFSYGSLEKESGWGAGNELPPFHNRCRCTADIV